ncbi:mediator of DNA damage checkpoint protein 1-like [Argopecten irradians]|uniref:mediator of DNA damage checkpoint protein 1-like n=1 Tax=Argopecten irradians TaxID=31199 RepID=UPI0037157527
MELNNSFFSDDEEDQCEKVGQANASKKWLNSTFASLAQLEQVKPNVYNVGLVDPRELKGNNLTSNNKRSQSFTDLTTNPLLSTLISQKTAWGSNGSIPDLVKQIGQIDGRPHRPESAKTSARRYRPSSGKKQRPESAKEGSLPPRPPKISVRGAKVDTVGRPAKHTPYQSVTTGWAGPPAGMKYPDAPSEQGVASVPHSVPCTPPPPPQGTPVPHLDINVEIPNEDEGDSDDDDMVKLKYTKTKTEAPHPVELLRRPTPESLHLNLDIPTMDEEEIEEDSDLDTERLLEKAEKYSTSKKPDDDDFINQVTEANESGDFEESHDKPVEPTIPEEDEDSFSFHSRIESSSDSDGDWTDEEAPINPADSKKSSEESKPVEKFVVKFIEERNVTIDITPRNAGHKVGRLSPTKQEGQRSKGKGVVSVEEEQKLKAALSVKSAGSKPMVGFVDYSEGNAESYVPQVTVTKKGQRPSSAVTKKIEHDRPQVRQRPSSATAVRPSSKPVGRSLQKPITQIIVDYGEEERKRKILRKKLREKDVVTMVEQVTVSEDEASEESDEDVEITPDLLRPGSPTKCTSEPTKNYYEISRQSAIGRSSVVDKMFEKLKEGASGQPTTMLSDLGEIDSKESAAVKSVLDSQLLRINEKQMVTHQVDINREKAKAIRPPSAKVQHKPPIARTTDDHERPGSRLGFVAMAPEKDCDHTGNKKVTRRPMSAQSKQTKSPFNDEKKDISDLVEGTETTATQQENTPSSEVPGFTDRQLEIQRLMKKHLTRPLSSNSNNLPSPKSPKSPKCKIPKSPSTVMSSARADSKMSSSRSEPKVASPRSQKERAIDDMIEKHLKRPASAFTPDIMSESFGDSSPEPPPSPVPVAPETESTPPTLTLPTTKPTKGRIHRAASLPSPKSTLVSELTAAERSGAGVSCNHGCAHGHGHAETPGLSSKTNVKSSFYTRAKSAPVKRKTAAPKIRYTKPLYLNTVNHSDYPETEEAQECTVMQAKLAAKGVNISAKTLERALYPPSGQTTYYEIKASLPKSQSLGLLSHPKVWLPEEYKQLRSAEKALDKVNEIMYMQKKAEERKAKIADGTAVKKKKKKGKKRPTSSLKRSKSFT